MAEGYAWAWRPLVFGTGDPGVRLDAPELFGPEVEADMDYLGGRLPAMAIPPVWQDRYRYVSDLKVGGAQAAGLWLYEVVRDVEGAEVGDRVVIRAAHTPPEQKEHRITRLQLGQLRHDAQPGIVRFLEEPIEAGGIRWEVSEYCQRGTLAEEQEASSGADHVERRSDGSLAFDPLPDARIVEVVRDLAPAIAYLSSPAVQLLHTDIKPANILVKDDGHVVLTDFGSAIHSAAMLLLKDTHGRTSDYAPYQDEAFSQASEWQQLGFVAFSMATGSPSPSRFFLSYDYSGLSGRVTMLLRGLLCPVPGKRWGFAQVDQWLNGLSPDLPDVDVTDSATRFARFMVEFANTTCEHPRELGAMLGENWSAGLRFMQEVHDGQEFFGWLTDLLHRTSHAKAGDRVAALSQQAADDRARRRPVLTADVLLARLISILDPEGPPSYSAHGYVVALHPTGLASLAEHARQACARGELDDPAVVTMERLFSDHLLAAFQGPPNSRWLRGLDEDWHTALAQLHVFFERARGGVQDSRAQHQRQLVRAGLPEEKLFGLATSEWEKWVEGETTPMPVEARAAILRYLVDPAAQRQLFERVRTLRQPPASDERWFESLWRMVPEPTRRSNRAAGVRRTPLPARARTVLGRVRDAVARFFGRNPAEGDDQ